MRILFCTYILQIALCSHTSAQAIAGSPKSITAFSQALELFEKGKYQAAQHYMDVYVQLYAGNLQAIEAQYYASLCAMRLNDPDGEARLRQFIAAYPYHRKTALAYYELGNFYSTQQDYKQSLTYYLAVDTKQLDLATQHALQYHLAYAYLCEKDFVQALDYFNKIKNSDNPYTYAANYYAGYIALRNGDYDCALADLKKAGQNIAYQPVVPYLILEVLYQQKLFSELVAYSSTLKNEPIPLKNQEDIALLTAEAYFFLEEYPAATQHYETYLALQEGAATQEVRYRLAYALYKSAEDYKALRYFKEVALQEGLLGQLSSYYVGLLYLKTDQKNLALAAFDQARKSDFVNQVQEEAFFQYAKVNYDLGNLSMAIEGLEKFQQTYPKSKHIQEANNLLSNAYLHTNNYDLAIAYIEQLPTQSASTRHVYQQVTLYKGQACFNNAWYDQAEHWLQKSLSVPYAQTSTLQAHLWLGETLAAKQLYKPAITHYQAVMKQATKHTAIYCQALYGLAYAYFNTSDYQHALSNFLQYTAQKCQQMPVAWTADALARTADCYYVLKDYQQALKLYDRVLATYPAHAHYQKALIEAMQGHIQAAQENLAVIINRYMHTAYYEKALLERACLALKNQEYATAIQGFTELIQKKPYSSLIPDALLHRAIAAVNLQQYAQAEKDYATILQDYPMHAHAANALLELPEILAKMGKPEKLQQYLASYEAANPSSHSLEGITFETAKGLFYNQSYAQSIEQFSSFITHYPTSSLVKEAWFLIAESYYRLGNDSQALAHYHTAIQDKTSFFHNKALLRMAIIAYNQQDFQTALAYYEQLKAGASNKKENYYALEGIMKTSHVLQQYDKVKEAASLIMEQGNITVNATYQAALYLGKAAMQQGKNQEAVDYFNQVLATSQDSYAAEAQYLIAKIYYENAEYNRSLESLFTLNKQFSTYQAWVNQGFLLIADNYLALNELFQAKATLQSIIENAQDAAIIKDAQQRLVAVNQQVDSIAQATNEKEHATDREFKTWEP